MSEAIRAYPLQWPVGWKRTPQFKRTAGRFAKKGGNYGYSTASNLSVFDGIGRVCDSLLKMGVKRDDLVISSNLETRLDGLPRSGQRRPEDPGIAVYWRNGKETRCMAIDTYTTVEQNIAAVAATLEAMRAIERHGGAEILNRAFTGFAALPEHASDTPSWRDVLGLKGEVSVETVEFRYRELAKEHHPDKGGDAGAFAIITRARDMAIQELRG